MYSFWIQTVNTRDFPTCLWKTVETYRSWSSPFNLNFWIPGHLKQYELHPIPMWWNAWCILHLSKMDPVDEIGTLVLACHVPLFIIALTIIPSTPDGPYRPCLLLVRPGQLQIVQGFRMPGSLLSSFIVGAGLEYNFYILEGPEFGWPQNWEVSDRTAGKTTSVWNFCAGIVLLYGWITLCWSWMQGLQSKGCSCVSCADGCPMPENHRTVFLHQGLRCWPREQKKKLLSFKRLNCQRPCSTGWGHSLNTTRSWPETCTGYLEYPFGWPNSHWD